MSRAMQMRTWQRLPSFSSQEGEANDVKPDAVDSGWRQNERLGD